MKKVRIAAVRMYFEKKEQKKKQKLKVSFAFQVHIRTSLS